MIIKINIIVNGINSKIIIKQILLNKKIIKTIWLILIKTQLNN